MTSCFGIRIDHAARRSSARTCAVSQPYAKCADTTGGAAVPAQKTSGKKRLSATKPFLHEPGMKLRIDKAIYGGSGLGRVSDEKDPLFGKTVFVPFTLPGETVEIHVAEDKRSYATGEIGFNSGGVAGAQPSAVSLLRKLRRLSLSTLQLRKSIADEALHSAGGTLARPTEEFAGDRSARSRALCLSKPHSTAGSARARVCALLPARRISRDRRSIAMPHRRAACCNEQSK